MTQRKSDRKLIRQADSDDSNNAEHCSSSSPSFCGSGSFQRFTFGMSRQPVSLINLAAAHSPKQQSRYNRPPMVKNHTIDDSVIKSLCSSNDNLTDFGKNAVKTLYNYGAKKFGMLNETFFERKMLNLIFFLCKNRHLSTNYRTQTFKKYQNL
uniref:Uncharacterized protein n=1 Tax=Romanomermis culicivorax TaxID=13658 RepID=A0A915I382_ROMCU